MWQAKATLGRAFTLINKPRKLTECQQRKSSFTYFHFQTSVHPLNLFSFTKCQWLIWLIVTLTNRPQEVWVWAGTDHHSGGMVESVCQSRWSTIQGAVGRIRPQRGWMRSGVLDIHDHLYSLSAHWISFFLIYIKNKEATIIIINIIIRWNDIITR